MADTALAAIAKREGLTVEDLLAKPAANNPTRLWPIGPGPMRAASSRSTPQLLGVEGGIVQVEGPFGKDYRCAD